MQRIVLKADPTRVLIVKPSAIGDVVHALPVLALLKRRWPNAKFSWLVTPICSGLLDGHPLLDEVIKFDRKGLGAAWKRPSSLRDLGRFASQLRQRKFDVAIDLQGLFRSGWLTFATRAPVRIGLSDARELSTLFYTHRVNVGYVEQHAVDRYLAVADALGAGRSPVEFPFVTNAADAAYAAERTPHRFALLFPGTNWPTKRWPIENFAALVRPLREKYGLETVVGGGPAEVGLANQIGGAINLCGATTLNQLVAIVARAAIVVSNDSGPMHIAAALGRPLVAPFGPTNPIRTGPYQRLDSVIRLGLPCSPCYSRSCSHQTCLVSLQTQSVLGAIEAELRSVGVHAYADAELVQIQRSSHAREVRPMAATAATMAPKWAAQQGEPNEVAKSNARRL